MGQLPLELTPEKSPLHRLGYMIRTRRTAAGLSLRDLASMVFMSHSKLAKWETGQRTPKDRAEIEAVDRALDAGGELTAFWEGSICGNGRLHVSVSGGHVAEPVDAMVASGADPAALDDGEGIFVPARLRDGSVVFVQLDRRALLRSGLGLGSGAALGWASPTEASTVPNLLRRARAASAYGSTPVEHLQRTRQRLIDSDNLLGPHQALKAARDHIEVIKSLREEAFGSDRRDLLELQTQYGEFTSWLCQDLGDWC
jgi:transcriptional regulator with XRE-family HTH domain